MNDELDAPEKRTAISYLLELRTRLVVSLAVVVILVIPCAYFQNEIFTFVAAPLLQQLPQGSKLIATGVASGFTVPLKLSFFVALFAAIPFLLYQLWAFVAPSLYHTHRRLAFPLILTSVVLFYVGVGFAREFVFPVMFQFFVSTAPQGVSMMTDISSYLGFVLTMFLAFGVAFEMPVAVVLLVITGAVSLDKLRNARGFVLIGIFVIAAILTPPDAVSQCIMAVPMYLLFEGGIIMARILTRAPPPRP